MAWSTNWTLNTWLLAIIAFLAGINGIDSIGSWPEFMIPRQYMASQSAEYNDVGPEVEQRAPVLNHVADWPQAPVLEHMGPQVAGVAANSDNTMSFFDRGNVQWKADSFDDNNVYRYKNNTPIQTDTVHVVDAESGRHIDSWGANQFWMPHGITVDQLGNTWVTDVALHQVLRFSKDNHDSPDLVLGEAFVPGSDANHFCKPTDIAVSSQGFVYISDGYCNSRIVVYTDDGQFVGSFGSEEDMSVPHSLTLIESEDMLCVADRDNHRVLCYTAGLMTGRAGKLLYNVQHQDLARVFAIQSIGDIILALSVPDEGATGQQATGLTLDLRSEQIVGKWAPKDTEGFQEPHDLALSADGQSVIVTDLGPKSRRVYKFELQ